MAKAKKTAEKTVSTPTTELDRLDAAVKAAPDAPKAPANAEKEGALSHTGRRLSAVVEIPPAMAARLLTRKVGKVPPLLAEIDASTPLMSLPQVIASVHAVKVAPSFEPPAEPIAVYLATWESLTDPANKAFKLHSADTLASAGIDAATHDASIYVWMRAENEKRRWKQDNRPGQVAYSASNQPAIDRTAIAAGLRPTSARKYWVFARFAAFCGVSVDTLSAHLATPKPADNADNEAKDATE
tara:strand:- start:563 stop:1288 length:726 start_codon:yes stop_codon:yes gene_type:complete